MNRKISSSRIAAIHPINVIHRAVHIFLLLSIAVLFALPYANKNLIVTVYEALQPITSVAADISILSHLYGRASPNLYEMSAYAAMAYLLILALHANFLLAIRRELVSASAIPEDVQLSWHAYMCRSFYSRLSPTFSMHCPSSIYDERRLELPHGNDKVQLTRGMSHREAIRVFLDTRGSSPKENYLTAFLMLFLFLVLYGYWLDQKPERFGSLFDYGTLMIFVYAQVHLMAEAALLAIAYFAPHKHKKEKDR